MIDINKKYRTRDGREVRIYATDGGGRYPVHGAVRCGDEWFYDAWNENGQFCNSKKDDSDLIEVKPRHKREVWLNVRPDTTILFTYPTRELADLRATRERTECIKIELDYEEGEGL